MDICVPTVHTKFTIEEYLEAFVAAWKTLFNDIPKKEQVAIFWAQYSIETGGGGSCFCNNLGNIKKFANDSHPKYCMLSNTWEMENGVKKMYQPPNPQTWFRAYDTLAEGMQDYLHFLSSGRYKAAFQAALSGDPEQFAHKLKIAGYYTAPESDYISAVRYRFNSFMKIPNIDSYFVKSLAPELEPEITEADIKTIPPEVMPLPTQDPVDDGPIKLTPVQSVIDFFLKLFKK